MAWRVSLLVAAFLLGCGGTIDTQNARGLAPGVGGASGGWGAAGAGGTGGATGYGGATGVGPAGGSSGQGGRDGWPPPTVWWSSTEQTEALPGSFTQLTCEENQVPVTCGDANEANITRELLPGGSSGYAIRLYMDPDLNDFNRAQLGVNNFSAINTAYLTNVEPVYIFSERYIPKQLEGTGSVWVFDFHQTGPGVTLWAMPGMAWFVEPGDSGHDCSDDADYGPVDGYLAGNGTHGFSSRGDKPHVCTRDYRPYPADTGLVWPTGVWFEHEIVAQRESSVGADDGIIREYINNVLVFESTTVSNWVTTPATPNETSFYWKLYGGPYAADWGVSGTDYELATFFRNASIASGKQSDGVVTNQTSPCTTCLTQGYECGTWRDPVCASDVDCDAELGGCGGGETCVSNVCER